MVSGAGYTDGLLSDSDVHEIVDAALSGIKFGNKRILAIIPDTTRSAPIPLLYRSIYQQLAPKVKVFDVLVALGTHHPMSRDQIYKHVGISEEEHKNTFSKTSFFNHLWKDQQALVQIGVLSEDTVEAVSDGLFRMSVPIKVNKLILDYDHLMILGPVFPHEVAGFSGGNKYFFPGIAGQEIIDFFHWLGALITNCKIIGKKDTPVRKVIDLAASHIPVERSCFAMVVEGNGLAGLYYGSPEDAWSISADLSNRLHITYKDQAFHTVLSVAPEMYDDLWVGGKCMYKLEPVVADGGTLIIYAPHISEISYTHGKIIDEIGYHTKDYFLKQWDSFKIYPWGVLAHSTHVKGTGSFDDGIEKSRIDVVLATSIPEERCRRVNLGYVNYRDLRLDMYQNKEHEGFLFVPRAGEMLYRLRGEC